MKKKIILRSRANFLTDLYNSGTTDMDRIIREVKKAEKKGSLEVRPGTVRDDSFYKTHCRWYLGQLQRAGRIKGFLNNRVGRPTLA